jgi:hypothetical protein
MTISSRFIEPSLMSPRTAKYVEAMIRGGDNFDYDTWLKRVRHEEAQAKPVEAASSSGELVAAGGKSIGTSDYQYIRPNQTLPLVPRVPCRPHRQAKSQTPKARLRRWLEKVRHSWGEFQASRRRDAVYDYLAAVFAIVAHYRIQRRTKRLLRHAFEFANLPFDKNADPFAAVIRCTCGGDVDNKTISKWARALRYPSRRKEPDMPLKKFMKEAGGINACAARYARYYGRRPRL